MPARHLLRDCTYTLGAQGLRILGADNPMIFILGTMRSGSTLLGHLIFTNPHIIGVGEAWRTYRSPLDLNRSMVKLLLMRRTGYRKTQLFQDTLLHDHLLPDPSLLCNKRILPVFLLRKTKAVLASLFRAQFPDYQTWPQIEMYYRARMATLANYATITSGKAVFVRYEELMTDAESTLCRLQEDLNLEVAFDTAYQVYNFTGRRVGDQSPFIRKGKIIPTRPTAAVQIPDNLLKRCEAAFDLLLGSLNPRRLPA